MTEGNEKMAAKSGNTGRGLKVALFLSLAANLLVVGLVAGTALRHDGRIERRGNVSAAIDAGLGPFGQAMTRDQRRGFADEFGQRSGDFRRNRDEVRQQVGDMLVALRAEPFDADAVRRLFNETQVALNQRQQLGTDILIGQLQTMTASERLAFAQRLEESFKGMRKPKR